MRTIFVYIELQQGSVLAGRLWPRLHRGRESATFEYDQDWLTHPQRFSLEPALYLGAGPQHTAQEQAIFAALGDCAPDRCAWANCRAYSPPEKGGWCIKPRPTGLG